MDSAGILRFRSTIEINNINPYVLVSAEDAQRLKQGWRKPMPVRIRVNGAPEAWWHINMMPIGDGSFYLYLHAEVRTAAACQVGDAVEVELAFDDGYRSGPAHPMPPEFGAALESNAVARQAWEALIPSLKKEILRYFHQVKSAEAKARHLERAMYVLSGGKGRFMARSWNGDGD
ncbi:YdeI/OmpD-associated family protein [Dyella sp. LX-66]|uniref:YdeI/OmpD-associated family protein n=1 Tax=unclassified Dyella TaxID=2634549 RepID=UPI001BE0B2C2|nr:MULTISPECIES: YdeI/OmpD-associated family protein [unclassified Dyella]MBT2119109.1 YdeI/OmpD-associated family protein [Dyella sp. LX-1]MBT2141480.1 YdeI/OmpD-associated family protein [Dyella sp. LX-66]